ncbi:MAG: hypothetical protein ACON4M_09770 [Crocinitomicaceae bacterium]
MMITSDKIILVNMRSTLKVVQELFNQEYPFLKITFFSKSANQRNGFLLKQVEELDRSIGDFAKDGSNDVNLTILPSMSVNELDLKIQSLFRLTIKIFRQSGSLWIPINETESWSIDAQNNEGKVLST